ncbi:MAG TPA: hypothetical protein VFC58_05930 [Desulfosporosinus sp.]|nr:hypothetical protein [Desulfosporosinus sp.]
MNLALVVLSRFANTLMLNLSDIKQPSHYHYFVLDDQGKSLYVIGNGQGSASKQNISFVKGKEDLNEITLIPYTFKSDYDLNPIKWLPKSTKVLPIVFHPGNDSAVSVKKIESDNLITKVYYSVEGLYPEGYVTKMVLIDDKGKVILPRGGSEILIDPETNEFMAEFDTLDKNIEYKVATPQLNDITIFKEYKISIPLK